MIKIKFSAILSPLGIFFIYILASGLAIMGFRFILPGQAVPLKCFSISWRLTEGLLEYLNLFPALALSALVIPFGFFIRANDKNSSLTPKFLDSIKMSIITAIVASVLYGFLFSLILPLAQNYEANLISKGKLYHYALEKAQENAAEHEWDETLHFMTICEEIWPDGSEHTKLKIEAEIRTAEERMASLHLPGTQGSQTTGFPGNEPLSVTEALDMAETALAEERYFDAHWLATLGGRLARPGSIEVATAARLAGRAWAGVNSLAPNARETQNYTIYRLKREGYEALVGEEWIRSYYIFLELSSLSPSDPDVAKYFALSEEGVKQAAFFIDEIELSLEHILPTALFSLPYGLGRIVIRISSLTTAPDTVYGIGIEIMAFDMDGKQLWSLEAPYAKIMPMTLDSGPSLAILLRALDRTDKNKRWEPEILSFEKSSFEKSGFEQSSPGQNAPGNAEILLPLQWETFLLLSNLRGSLAGLSPIDLRKASSALASYGYLPQVFEAELLQRFTRPLFLLPLTIFAIAIGWRYRALKRPRYMAIPMLGILPLVFNGAVHFCRYWINDFGIWAVLSLGFTTAAIVCGALIVLLLVLSFIFLAVRHG